MILSVSRRTDIPAFYSDWFMNRLKEGYVLTRNPFNPSQINKILLSPDFIDCIVFWTKDPLPMMNHLKELDDMGYHYYFQFTLTPYDKKLERNLREKEELIRTIQTLSEMIGKERVCWRYDPIILNETITEQYHIQQFAKLCGELKEAAASCTFSFVDLYAKLSRAVKGNIIREINKDEMQRLVIEFAEIGEMNGIELKACCEETDFTSFGIKPSACIDKKVIERICGYPIKDKKDYNQRSGCGCVKSVDIGAYNTCRNGCIYCYANHSEASITKNCSKYNRDSDILIPSV